MTYLLTLVFLSGIGTSPNLPDVDWLHGAMVAVPMDRPDELMVWAPTLKHACDPLYGVIYTTSICVRDTQCSGELRVWRHVMWGQTYSCDWLVPQLVFVGQEDYFRHLLENREPCEPEHNRCKVSVGLAAPLSE